MSHHTTVTPKNCAGVCSRTPLKNDFFIPAVCFHTPIFSRIPTVGEDTGIVSPYKITLQATKTRLIYEKNSSRTQSPTLRKERGRGHKLRDHYGVLVANTFREFFPIF